jgi:endonuclease/exonuclease/phosphatase family metal-dependent hydrolase
MMKRLAVGIAFALMGSAPPNSADQDSNCVARNGSGVRWMRVAPSQEHADIDRWCAPVGAPVRISTGRGEEVLTGPLVIVSWNTHVGAGDIDRLVADLRSGRLTGGRPVTSFVLLLQEVYRGGAGVPSESRRAYRWASAQRPPGPGGKRDDVVAAAKRLGLEAFYAPSMRNGAPGATDEDRGNAILSTLAMSDLTAIELPLENQRRVALGATVSVRMPGHDAMPLRLVSTHFTNMVMHHLWVLSESGRLRQARALANALPAEGPLIVGGDFNSWFGYRDAAYKQLAGVVPAAASDDRRATFGPLKLDHILARLPKGWRASVRRADSRYGSDHYPLTAVIEAPTT